MKMKKHSGRQKGILGFAKSYRLLGVKCFSLGLLIGILRERRSAEIMHSIWCEFLFRLKPVHFPTIATKHFEVDSIFFDFVTNNGHLLARKQGIVRSESILIACEYGQPGARVLMKNANDTKIFTPYRNDPLVWHIHAICHVIDDFYIVTTGDSRKYADLMKINADECRIFKRLYHRLGGFTAIINIDGNIWAGSDLSERVNYIRNTTTGETYFLPGRASGAYVINIVWECESLLVYTKKLNFDTGYVFTFNLISRKFTSGNSIIVHERVIDDAVPA